MSQQIDNNGDEQEEIISVVGKLDSVEPEVLARRIKKECKNYYELPQFLDQILPYQDKHESNEELNNRQKQTTLNQQYECCYLAALKVCGEAAKKISMTKRKQRKNNHKFSTLRSTPVNSDSKELKGIKDTVLDILQKCPTEACRAKCITIHGQLGLCQQAIDLFRNRCIGNDISKKEPTNSSTFALINTFHAALATCVSTGEWKLALGLLTDTLEENPELVSTLSCNIVLQSMCKTTTGEQGMDLLKKMIDKNNSWSAPDVSSFTNVVHSLINMAQNQKKTSKENALAALDKAYGVLRWMMEYSQNFDLKIDLTSNNVMVDLLVREYRKYGDKGVAGFLEKLLKTKKSECDCKNMPSLEEIRSKECDWGEDINPITSSFVHWDDAKEGGLVKHFRGRLAFWAFASHIDSHRTLTVGLQPHREPSKNGIKIQLYEKNSLQKKRSFDEMNNHPKPSLKKVGYLLMINSATPSSSSDVAGTSTFLGLFLDPEYRKEKLSKLFIAIWLDLCLRAQIIPETGTMNKPLLALVLQDTFGFRPVGNGGFDVQLIKESSTKVAGDNESLPDRECKNSQVIQLYSPTASKTLIGGAIGTQDLKRENIQLLVEEPAPSVRGRTFRLGSALHADMRKADELAKICEEQLSGPFGTGKLAYYGDDMPWKKIMLGT